MLPALLIFGFLKTKSKKKLKKSFEEFQREQTNLQVCRTCFGSNGTNTMDDDIAGMLRLITGLDIQINKFQCKICLNCKQFLDTAIKFKRKCLEVQEKYCKLSNVTILNRRENNLERLNSNLVINKRSKKKNVDILNDTENDDEDVKLSELSKSFLRQSDSFISTRSDASDNDQHENFNAYDDVSLNNENFDAYDKNITEWDPEVDVCTDRLNVKEEFIKEIIRQKERTEMAAKNYDYKRVYVDWDNDKWDRKFAKQNRALKAKRKRLKAGPHVCKHCKKVLGNVYTLNSHMKIHTGLGFKYMCENCGKQCRSRYALITHKRAQHGLERADRCRHCDYMALNKQQLLAHERRHTGEKPYICDHCGSAFHRRANLVQHLAIHLDKKTIQCDECPSKFKSIKFLRTHKNQIHRTKEYYHICYVCSNNFSTPRNVRIHLFRIHGIPRNEQGPIKRVKMRYCFENI